MTSADRQRSAEMRKQISLFIPLSDWKAIRMEAARQKVPMTELCRRWMKPQMERLQERTSSPANREGH